MQKSFFPKTSYEISCFDYTWENKARSVSCGVLSLDKKLHTQTVHERIKRYQGKDNKIEEMCDESTILAWEKTIEWSWFALI